MPKHTSWNIPELEQKLIETKSFTATARHYDVSRERIRQVANKHFTRERLLEIGIALETRYPQGSVCLNCSRPIGPGKLPPVKGRCVRCDSFFQRRGFEHTDEYVRQVRIRVGQSLPRLQKRSHCFRGHAMSGDNVYTAPDGHRRCKECGRVRHAQSMQNPEYRERQKHAERRYLQKHSKELLSRKRERYASDPAYRERLKGYDRKRREKNRQANGNDKAGK